MKRIIKNLLIIVISIIVLTIIATPFVIVIVNDYIAITVKNDLKKLPLPYKTELIDSISAAGKLAGNGNGMQYFGAILIKSELTLEELDSYYAQYRNNEFKYMVDVQCDNKIEMIEHHGSYSFNVSSETFSFDNYYIIYTWGD